MAYVPGFKYDLFVSYASEDHDKRMVKLIDDLRSYLTRELGKLFPDDSIFFDRRALNQRPVNWRDELKEAAQSAAILLPLLSPSYASSKWCAKELEYFDSSGHSLHSRAANQCVYRILPVLWWNLDAEFLSQLDPRLQAAQQDRTLTAEQLGTKLVEGLKLMRRACKIVYLGESELDTRDKVRDELSRAGYRVLPESPQAFGAEATVRKHMSDALLSLHFVGGQMQQRTLDAIKWSLKTCSGATIVYHTPECDLTEVEREWLEWVEEDIRNSGNSDRYDRVDQKNLDKLLQTLRDRLDGYGFRPATNLGIAFEETDKLQVESVASEIENATGFVIQRHGLGLADIKKSRSVLFYWGAAEGRRLRRAVTFSVGRKAFLVAPPPKPAEYQIDLTGGPIFQQQGDQFRVDDVRPFLKDLGWQG
jgi:hypothetical protein